MTHFRIVLFACCIAILAAACRPNVARLENDERLNSAYRKALESVQAGKLDEAIEQYTKLLLDQPRLASAHLELALLLHDHKQDYLGAMYHYQAYLQMRPDADKKALVQDRLRLAEQLIIAQLIRRGGGTVDRSAQEKQQAEIERLTKQVATLQAENASLKENKLELENQIKSLISDVNRLRRLVDRLQLPETPAREHTSRQSALPRLSTNTPDTAPVNEQSPKRPKPLIIPKPEPDTVDEPVTLKAPQPLEPTESATATVSDKSGSLQAQKTPELLAKPPATTAPKEEVKIEIPATTLKPPEQSKLLEAPKPLVAPKPLEPSPAPVAPAATPQPQPQNDIEGSEPLLRGFSTPAAPKNAPRINDKVRTYVVQPGDTLYRISEKCYNDPNQWKKIREANSTRIGVDDRVRAGQILIIP